MRSRATRLVVGLTAASVSVACLGAGATSALGHASLEKTSPERGAELAQPPSEVRFDFSESVELSFGALRVFDSAGEEVQSGDPEHPGGDAAAIAVALPDDLPDGSYTATYRVVSADSHPVSGGFVFAVGKGSAAPGASVSELLDDPEAGTGTKVGFAAARAGSYAAIALALGGAVFLLAVWASALANVGGANNRWVEASRGFGSRSRTIFAGAIGLGLICTIAGVIFQGALASGTGPLEALDTSVIGEVLDTRFGEVWAIRFGIWVALAVVFAVAVSQRGPAPALRPATLGAEGTALETPPRALVWIGGALLVALAATPAFAGHASSLDPTWALVPSTIVHVTAMSVWVGGLVMLVAALPAATRNLEPPDRTRLLAACLRRFSPIALGAVIVLLATGILQSLLELDSLSALVDTAFGRLILVKSALLAALIGLGAVNRRRSIPKMDALARGGETPGSAGLALRRILRAEVALVAAAIVATSFLAAETPNDASGGGPPPGLLTSAMPASTTRSIRRCPATTKSTST